MAADRCASGRARDQSNGAGSDVGGGEAPRRAVRRSAGDGEGAGAQPADAHQERPLARRAVEGAGRGVGPGPVLQETIGLSRRWTTGTLTPTRTAAIHWTTS